MHVILVHGAGLDQRSFDPVVERLTIAGVGVTARARRGYDGRPATDQLDRHVDDLVTTVSSVDDDRVVVAGVSGGATLALSLARRPLPRHVSAVVHEPLLGPLAGEQHHRITDSIATLLGDDRADAVDAFVERLVTTETWRALDDATRARCRAHGAAVRTEAAGFARFAVTGDELAAAAPRLTWTVGRRSATWRHTTADIAAGLGIAVREVDATHTPQIEDPDGWIDAVLHAEAST